MGAPPRRRRNRPRLLVDGPLVPSSNGSSYPLQFVQLERRLSSRSDNLEPEVG